MKANELSPRELRIGNYLTNFLGEVFQANGLTIGNFHHNEFGLPEPIPLTEEWLLKFGFKQHILCYRKVLSKDRYLMLALCNDKGLGEFYFYVKDNNDFTGFEIRIFSVHQLQNLYFALTGEELTIKQTSLSLVKDKDGRYV